MKIGSRVRLSSTVNFRFKDMREPSGIPRGYVTKIISRGWRGRFLQIKYDHGPIIAQAVVSVPDDDTPQTLADRVLRAEHRIYPEAIALFAEGRLSVNGRRVRVNP